MPSLKLTPRRLALIAVIVFIAVAIALTLYWQRPPQQDYVTAPARPGDIENAVLATGRLMPSNALTSARGSPVKSNR